MRRILFTMLVVALLLLVSVPVAAAGGADSQPDRELVSSPYPVYGLDLQHTNRSAYTGPTTTPEIEWTATLNGSAEMPPSIAPDGTVYLGIRSTDEGLYAYNPDGTQKWWWSRPVEQGVSGTAAVIEDYVYINFGTHWPPDDYGMAKLSQADGSEVWTVSSNDSAYMSSPAVDSSGNVYFGSYDCYLRSVADDGSLNWAYSAGAYPDGIIFCSPAIGDDGTIYVGDDGHGAIALNPDGSVKWTTSLTDRPLYGPNILGNGNIVYRSQDGTITALDDSGVSQWSHNLGGGYATGAVAADGTTLYVKAGSYDDKDLMALDASGSTVWTYNLGTAADDAPMVGTDGTIYVSCGSSVSAINADGTELWTLSLDQGEAEHSYSVKWPVIGGDGILYVILYDSWDYGMSYATKIVRLYAETSSVTVTADAPDSELPEDSDFTVDIDISDVTDFDACNYDVTFDATVLRLDDVTAGLIGSTAIPVDLYNELSPGTYRIIQNVPGLTGVTGSGYLAVLHFHVIGSGGDSSAITLSNGMLSNNQAVEITASWVGDTVTVTSVVLGDANGDGAVNALDITKVERIIAGLDAETPGADANSDGAVNALDITKIEMIIAGLS
jgi:hypothetical protein